MSSKPLQTGGEIDSWCTKCLLILNHRIVAMVQKMPVKVECSTCSSVHKYRKNPPGTTKAGSKKEASPRSSPPSSRAESARARARWEEAISGKKPSDFKAYQISSLFREGELVQHSKFGEGLVEKIVDAKKIEVLFHDQTRLLAQGMD